MAKPVFCQQMSKLSRNQMFLQWKCQVIKNRKQDNFSYWWSQGRSSRKFQRMSSSWCFVVIQTLLFHQSCKASDRRNPKLEPTPNFTEYEFKKSKYKMFKIFFYRAICYKDTPCPVRFVRAKIYIEDELYEKVLEFREVGNIKMSIKSSCKIFLLCNF